MVFQPINGASGGGDGLDDIHGKSPSSYDLQIPGQEVLWAGIPRPDYSQEVRKKLHVAFLMLRILSYSNTK